MEEKYWGIMTVPFAYARCGIRNYLTGFGLGPHVNQRFIVAS